MRVFIKSTFTVGDAGMDDNIYDNRDAPYEMDDSQPGPAQGTVAQLVVAAVGPTGAYIRVGLNGITPKHVMIITDGAINILINSTSADPTNQTPIPLVPIQAQVSAPTPAQLVPPQSAKLELAGTSLTPGRDLWIQNPAALNAAPANVTIVVAG